MADDVLFEMLHLEIVTYFTNREDNGEFVRNILCVLLVQ